MQNLSALNPFLESIMTNIGTIVVIMSSALIVLILRTMHFKGRQIIHINKVIIPNELAILGFNQEMILERLRYSLYDSVHNFHDKRKVDKGVFYSMPFEQVFKVNTDRAAFKISDTNSFWKPIWWIINFFIYKFFSNSFELCFQKVEDMYTCKVYSDSEFIFEEKFEIENEAKTSFVNIIGKISLGLIELICPPCYIASIELFKKNNNSKSTKKIDAIISNISNKLSLGSNNFCCDECKNILNSKKYLRKCNRIQGFMLAPIGAKYISLLNKSYKTKVVLENDDEFYNQLDFMRKGFNTYLNSKSFWWKLFYSSNIRNKKKWLYFFEGRIRHLWFDNLVYKKLFDLQESLLSRSKKYTDTTFIKKYKTQYDTSIRIYENGLEEKSKWLFIKRDKKHDAWFLHNIADLDFRYSETKLFENNILKRIQRAYKYNPRLIDGQIDYCYFSFRASILQNNYNSTAYGNIFHNDGLIKLRKYLKSIKTQNTLEAQVFLYGVQIGSILRLGKRSKNLMKSNSAITSSAEILDDCIGKLKNLEYKLSGTKNFEILFNLFHLLWLAKSMKLFVSFRNEYRKNDKRKKEIVEIKEYFIKANESCEKFRDIGFRKWTKALLLNNSAVLAWVNKDFDANFDLLDIEHIENCANIVKFNPVINHNVLVIKAGNFENSTKLLTKEAINIFSHIRMQSYQPILKIIETNGDKANFETVKNGAYRIEDVYL